MKLNTDKIKDVIVIYAGKHVHNVYEPSSPEYIAAVDKKLWKRFSKMSCKKRIKEFELSSIEEIVDYGWEFEDILDATIPVTLDCIVRDFGNTVLESSLDPLVITDPTDTKILMILWHSD